MTKTVLLDLLDRYYESSKDYCVICLRGDKETRLLKPKYLNKYFQSIHQFSCEPTQLVCYICERQAALAYSFKVAVQVSMEASIIIDQLQKKTPKQRAAIREDLATAVRESNKKTTKMTKSLPKKWMTNLLECERNIQRVQKHYQLLKTEILIISTTANETELITHPNLQPEVNSQQEIQNAVQTIIIPDEDEIKTETVVIEDENINEDKHEKTVRECEKDNHTGNLFIVVPLEIDASGNTKLLLHPIVVERDKAKVPSLHATIEDGKLIGYNLREIKIAVRHAENLSFVCDPNEVNNLLRKVSRCDKVKRTLKRTVCETPQLNRIQTNKQTSKYPQAVQVISDRIDWEDKIPMDVISFVDEENEKDVCKRARSTADLAISNVTSQKELIISNVTSQVGLSNVTSQKGLGKVTSQKEIIIGNVTSQIGLSNVTSQMELNLSSQGDIINLF